MQLISIDTETRDDDLKTKGAGVRRGGFVVGVAIAVLHDDGSIEAEYLPVKHPESENMPLVDVIGRLKALAASGVPVTGTNLLYDFDYLAEWGVWFTGQWCDIQVAEALIDENQRSYSLETLARKYLDEGKNDEMLYEYAARRFGGKATRKAQAGNIWRCPASIVNDYAISDVVLPLKILQLQLPIVPQKVWALETALQPLLLKMKRRGVPVHRLDAESMKELFTRRLETTLAQLKHLNGGMGVEVWAAASLARLFDKLGLKYRRTPTGKPSFTKEFLSGHHHPVAEAVLRARQYDKMRSTFLENSILSNLVDGRIHCQFNQLKGDEYGTVTGRMSSSLPNLQQIPARSEVGKTIRTLYRPEEGQSWVKLDYSQIEPRLLLSYARGPDAKQVVTAYANDPLLDCYNGMMESMPDNLNRNQVKAIWLGMCVAEGSLVLTDSGEVPIEKLTTRHKVWDGVEWVSHDGVVDMGIREVVTYDGVTGTPDHKVWTESGRTVCLGCAASEGENLCRSGDGANPIGVYGTVGDTWEKLEGSDQLPPLWQAERSLRGQRAQGGSELLSSEQVRRCEVCGDTQQAVRCDAPTLREWYGTTAQRPAVQRAGDSATHDKGGIHSLGAGAECGIHERQAGSGQDRQQRPLRTVEPAAGDTFGEPAEQVRVYDVVNAGPLHRFTCNGKLVSNTYGMGKDLMAANMGMDVAEAEPLFEAFHEGAPYIKQLSRRVMAKAEADGVLTTIGGRVRHFDLWEPREFDDKRPALSHDAAKEAYGKAIKRAFTYKALNSLIQGGAADVMKKAMVECERAGIFDVIGVPYLTVHDELDNSVDLTSPIHCEALREMVHIMETTYEGLRVPLIIDVEAGANWGAVARLDMGALPSYQLGDERWVRASL